VTFRAALRQYGEWSCPELACSWYLILDPEATQARSLHAEAGTLLASHPGVLAGLDGFRPHVGSLYRFRTAAASFPGQARVLRRCCSSA
jgi:hypothetical protein